MYLAEKLAGIRHSLEDGRGELTDTEIAVMRKTFEEEVRNLEALRALQPDEVGAQLVDEARRITQILRGFEAEAERQSSELRAGAA